MAGFSQVKVWGAEILYYTHLNAEFNNVYTYATPEYLEDYSTNVAQFRTSSVPSEAALPTTLAGEIEALRGEFKRAKNSTYWGDTATFVYQASPPVSMVWKDAATITVQAGNYFIGGQPYNLAANLDWTWTASAQNRGLDTGSESSSTATWYYLYGIVYSSAFGVVASLTAPTARFDTDLSGTDFDTNVYLGAFLNNASDDIEEFIQCGNKFMYYGAFTSVSHTGNTSVSTESIVVPTTANFYYGELYTLGPSTISGVYATSSSAAAYYFAVLSQYNTIMMPVTTPQTAYISTNNASGTVQLQVSGWDDKWL